MIKVVKFYRPVLLSPSQSEEWIVEDTVVGAKFVFLPYFRLYNPINNGTCHLTITHIFDLGMGDDPLWSGTEIFELVDEDILPNSVRDFTFTPQLDKDPKIRTYHKVKITNMDTVERVWKTIVFGLTETQMQTSKDSGVISTQNPNT